jgi:esterase/lipase superfamily enzyme
VPQPVAEGARQFRVFAATNRARRSEEENVFTADRSLRSNYASFEISVPPQHKPGEIEWPASAPDPQRSFAVLDQRVLDEQPFRAAISAASIQRDIGVFIHGYNVNYQEALYRLAQMTADANMDGVPVLFTWPSQAALSGYLADRKR